MKRTDGSIFITILNPGGFKRPVHPYFLPKQLLSICRFDGCLGLRELLVFNKGVSFRKARPSIHVQVQRFDLPIFAESIKNIIFHTFLVQLGHDDDPTLDSCIELEIHFWG